MSPDKKRSKPVDIYTRVSRVSGREGESFQSPKQQEDRCRAQLKADGLPVGEVFTDLDESGANASRPEFDKAIARVASGKSGGIIVYDLSRFGRSTRNVLDGIDMIEAHGAVFVSCAEKFDTSTGTGRFVLTMFAALRELERTQSAERWEVSKADARARGVHIGGPRAGYVRDEDGKLVEVPEYLDAVRAAFALRARGGSWRETAAILTEAGVPTSKSKGEAVEWSRQATRNVVQNPAYSEEHGGPVPTWQWRKAQPSAGEPRVRGQGHVLGQGLVRCSICGSGMHKSANGQRYVVLRCDTAGKGHPTMSFETARDYILSLAFSHVGRDAEEQARRRRVRARRAQAGRRGGAGGVRPGRRVARREAVPNLDPGSRADKRAGRAGRVRVGGRRALRPRGRPTPDQRPSRVREAARPGAAAGSQVDHRAGHAVARSRESRREDRGRVHGRVALARRAGRGAGGRVVSVPRIYKPATLHVPHGAAPGTSGRRKRDTDIVRAAPLTPSRSPLGSRCADDGAACDPSSAAAV